MSDLLRGARLKLKRAKEHIENLSRDVVAFKGYEVIRDDNPQSGHLVFRLRIKHQIPDEWATVIGDAIQNTRSAIDHLACALVIRESGVGALSRFTCFPITFDPKKLEAATSPEVKGMRQDAADEILALKPYKGGNDTLWALKVMNDRDKHRLLLPVGTETAALTMDMGMFFGIKMPIKFTPKAEPDEFPLKDGDVVLTIMKAARGPNTDEHPQFTFGIAFREPEIVERKPVIPTLVDYVKYVDAVVLPKFERFF